MNMDFTNSSRSSKPQNHVNTLSFTELLNTQDETIYPETFYQTQSPSYQTQSPSNQTQSPSSRTRSSKPKKPLVRWKVPEEKALVGAWFNTSKDPIVGNDQKGGTFWERVAACYAANPGVSGKRSANVCKQKWTKMNERVSKFNGYHQCVNRTYHSGWNDKSCMDTAYEMYYADQNVKFNLEHVWEMLKDEHKWCSLISESSKRSKLVDSSTLNKVFDVDDDIEERPLGVKAANVLEKKTCKGKIEEANGRSHTLNVLDQMWKVKKEELERKERISKQKILDSLICKTEPLSEIEHNLKNNLMNEMYNTQLKVQKEQSERTIS